MQFDVRIDELIVPGSGALDAARFGAACEAHLATLFGRTALGTTPEPVAADLLTLAATEPVTPEWLGVRIAETIYALVQGRD
jgi:hypothetical protein